MSMPNPLARGRGGVGARGRGRGGTCIDRDDLRMRFGEETRRGGGGGRGGEGSGRGVGRLDFAMEDWRHEEWRQDGKWRIKAMARGGGGRRGDTGGGGGRDGGRRGEWNKEDRGSRGGCGGRGVGGVRGGGKGRDGDFKDRAVSGAGRFSGGGSSGGRHSGSGGGASYVYRNSGREESDAEGRGAREERDFRSSAKGRRSMARPIPDEAESSEEKDGETSRAPWRPFANRGRNTFE